MELVKKHEPITGDHLAELLGLSKTTLRSDLSILVMLGILDAKPKVGYFLGSSYNRGIPSTHRLENIKVKDVQGIPVVVHDNTSVQDAVIMLFMENVGSLIVTDASGNLSGIVSRKDLLKVTMGNPGAVQMPISLVMTRQPNVIVVRPEDSVVSAADKMIKHEIDCLPVVQTLRNEEGHETVEVLGRITKTSMTRLLLDFATDPDIAANRDDGMMGE